MEWVDPTALFCDTKIHLSFSTLKSHSLDGQEADAEAYLFVCITMLREKCLLGYSHAQNSKQHLQINQADHAVKIYSQDKQPGQSKHIRS